jgi:hypothetical protein
LNAEVTSANRRIEQIEAAAAANAQPHADASSRVQECPDFEKQFGLPPGDDLDAETDAVLQKADKEAELRQAHAFPMPPPGVRPGSAAYHLFRDETYQTMRLTINEMRHQLGDYNEQKRQQFEKMKKEMMSATTAPDRRADSA